MSEIVKPKGVVTSQDVNEKAPSDEYRNSDLESPLDVETWVLAKMPIAQQMI